MNIYLPFLDESNTNVKKPSTTVLIDVRGEFLTTLL